MKGKFLVLSAVLALPLAGQAQSGPNKSYVGVHAGASFATGDFSRTDAENSQSGFAKTGLHLALDGATFFHGGKLGLAGQVAFSDNGRLKAADLQKLGDGYTDAFAVDFSTVRASGRYRHGTAMLGPTIMVGGDKLKLEVRGLVGIVHSFSTPEITVQLEDNPATTFVQRSSTSTVFGFQAGLGLHYAVTERVHVVLRGDYLGCSALTIDNENRGNSAGRLSEKQPVAAVNTTLGLAFAFGK